MTTPDRLFRRRNLSFILIFLFVTIYSLSYLTSDSPTSSPHQLSSPNPNPNNSEEIYRSRISTIRPVDTLSHSKTLGIASAIYVISLPRRLDRRTHMLSLARALNLEFTFINATDFKSPPTSQLVDELIERVRWQRGRIDEMDAGREDWPEADGVSSETFVWHAFPFRWAKDAVELAERPLDEELGISGADYWDLRPRDEKWEREHQMSMVNVEGDGEGEKEVLMTSSVENNIYKNEPLNKAMVSCFHSHVKALREVVKNKNHAAIIFEDDIDIEWDIQRILRLQWPSLPPPTQWDIVYLGHCWSEEYRGPSLPKAPMLHQTFHTLCTHGYVVSLSGALKILRYLRSPDYAYGKPIDHALKDLVQMHKIRSWSVYPPVVVQTKEDVSDIVGGVDTKWKDKEGLVDSTLERIEMVRNMTKGE